MNKKFTLLIIGVIFFSTFFFFSSQSAHASILDDIVNGVKNFFSPSSSNSQQVTLTSKIDLASNGDLNKNGQIIAGDIIKFTYTISNTTGNTYSFVTLKTNINTSVLNSINNIQGATSINDANHTITIPNLHINPNQKLTISFDIQTNYNKDNNQTISTEPELIDQSNNSITKGSKQNVTVNKMSVDMFNKFVHITQ